MARKEMYVSLRAKNLTQKMRRTFSTMRTFFVYASETARLPYGILKNLVKELVKVINYNY